MDKDKLFPLELRIKHLTLTLALLPIIIFTAACQTQPNQIFVEVDGTRQTLTTEATTVREVLAEANVVLGPQDRVDPDLYVELEPGLTIVVIRVREEIETERRVVPFERQTVVNEALAAGESRIAQLGANGEDEVAIRVVYENGIEIGRTEVSRAVVIEPVPEILVVGPQDTLPPVPIEGTVTYISNGNAWLMRDSSSSRRALTTNGNLDGRVFSLAPDGRRLLYTTELPNEIELPINEMWLASTTIVGEMPITLGIRGVLHAAWSPVVTESLVLYSTARRTSGPPGWQANNDLWLLSLPASSSSETAENNESPEPVPLIPPNTAGLYPWWGTSFAWSPDGTQLAYARPDQIGVIDLTDIAAEASPGDYTTPLVDFPPLQTFSDWAWVPGLSWSPDGQFVAAAVHGPPLASEPPEESPVFDLWLISTAGTISAKVAGSVGMWTNPAWGAAGIAFGQAVEPLRSMSSRYSIQLIDKDGSNKHQIFPFREELGVQLPELVWSPDGDELLFIYNGNLHLISRGGGVSRQLSSDGQASQPRWALAQAPLITGTVSITSADTITVTAAISGPSDVTSIPSPADILQTPTTTPTRRLTGTATVQPTGTVTNINSADNP